VREELPAAVDQLPAAGPEARQLHRRGGGGHHQAARLAREQVSAGYLSSPRVGVGVSLFPFSWVLETDDRICCYHQVVQDRGTPAGEDGQRDQERVEHSPQEEGKAGGAAAESGSRHANHLVLGVLLDDHREQLRGAVRHQQGARRARHTSAGNRHRHIGHARGRTPGGGANAAAFAVLVVLPDDVRRRRRGGSNRTSGDRYRSGNLEHHRRRLPAGRFRRDERRSRGGERLVVGELGEGAGPVGPIGVFAGPV
jgi:hypothetical protein